MVDKTVEHFGKIDALINNAGAIFWGTTTEFPVKRYDLVMDVNVRGAFLASQAAIPHMRANGGHIVMMSPPINPKAAVGKAPYIVSKFGMTMVGMAIDAEEPSIAAHALWPVTAFAPPPPSTSAWGPTTSGEHQRSWPMRPSRCS